MLLNKKDNQHLLATKIAMIAGRICLAFKEWELTNKEMRWFKGNSRREYLEIMIKFMISQFGILSERTKAPSNSPVIVKYNVNMEI